MKRKRLEHLIKVLRRAERKIKASPRKYKFDLGTWGHESTGPRCHTVACAAGWAVLDPDFQKAGLRQRQYGSVSLVPTFGGREGEMAMAQFLDIGSDTAWYLFFGAGSYPDKPKPKDVIKKIQTLLKVGEARFVGAEQAAEHS